MTLWINHRSAAGKAWLLLPFLPQDSQQGISFCFCLITLTSACRKPGGSYNYLLLSLKISLNAFIQQNGSFFMCIWMISIKFRSAQVSRLSQEAKDCINSSREQELNLCQILMETQQWMVLFFLSCTFSNSSSSTFLPSGNELYKNQSYRYQQQ